MARSSADPFSLSEIARRLRITRAALGYTQPMMSALAGLSTEAQAWSNYEQGIRRISLDVAHKLKTTLGLTLEWIYEGELETLKPELAAKIALQIRDEARKSRQH
jgi:transcriptional regulator with XRE-family HTH domain